MAPIVAPTASSEDEANFVVDGNGAALIKRQLDGDRNCADAPYVVSDGRDDDANAAPQPEGEEASKLFGESDNVGRRQSNLFAEDQIIQPVECAPIPQLSLMQSSPPSPSSPLGLEDVDIHSNSGTQSQVFDDFAVAIMSQIDADEALARQLQEEEDKKRVAPKPKAKPRVVPTIVDSILGEPSPWEVRSGNYARVTKDSTSSSSGQSDSSGSVSSGISMLTNSFRRWGNGMTAAATEFFGEDVGMQVRSSSSRHSGSDSQYRNEV